MAYTKYKMIPAALYQRLMEAEDDKVEYASPKPTKIMKQQLPDDAKLLLYSDAMRDLNIKLAKRREAPIIMQEKTPDVGEDLMPKLLNNEKAVEIYEFLKQQGISANQKGEVVVQGNLIPYSHLPTVIRALMNYHIGIVPGLKEVLASLQSTPSGLISSSVLKKHGHPALMPPVIQPIPSPHPTTSKSTPKAKKRKQKGGGILWHK